MGVGLVPHRDTNSAVHEGEWKGGGVGRVALALAPVYRGTQEARGRTYNDNIFLSIKIFFFTIFF